MEDEQRAQREPIEIPPELSRDQRKGKPKPGRVERKPLRAASGMLRVQRPIRPTSRTQATRAPLSYPRSTAGHTVWRDIPSWHQVREPNGAHAIVSATKAPPWVRKRKARAKAKLQKASRRLNRV